MAILTRVRELWLYISLRPAMAAAIIGLIPLSICVFMAIQKTPVPVVHDEYSYLLAADTFLHGRLANPTHPMWVFFESFQINMLPTYGSKYPPMQGFALAFGRLITGQAIVGVWISMTAAFVAIFWMLRAWLPPPCAFAGGLLAAFNGYIVISWGLTFWGGAMAMLGGALLYGAVPRLVNNPRVRDAVLCGIGIAIMAMSRPYEGLIASIPAAGYLFYGLFRDNEFSWRRKLSYVVLPIGLVLLMTVSFMGYYNYRTTGNALKSSYMAYTKTYLPVPLLFFMEEPPVPKYRHRVMRNLYIGYELERYKSARPLSGFVDLQIEKFKVYWSFFSPSLLTIFVLGIPMALKGRQFRFIFFSCLFFGLGIFLVIPVWPHYAAPFTAVIYLAIISSLKSLWSREFGGKRISEIILISVIVFSIVQSFPAALSAIEYRDRYSNMEKSAMTRKLEQKGGSHLVFVRYNKSHIYHMEWVWNGADIDGQQVVWARYMNEKLNKKLIDYYKDRQVWLMAPDFKPPTLMPYQG